jgi:transposase-like protein
VREVGQQLGVDATSLYRVVRKLEQESKVKKQGRELQPA